MSTISRFKPDTPPERTRQSEFYVAYPVDDGSDAYALARRARIASQRGHEIEAITLADAAVDAASQTDSQSVVAWALCIKARSTAIIGLCEEALKIGWRALGIAESSDDMTLQARALFSIGFVALETKEYAEAQKLLDRSLVCARTAQSDYDMFWALNNLSYIHGEQAQRLSADKSKPEWRQEIDQVFRISKSALETAMRLDAAQPRCYALLNLANAHFLNANLDEAEALIVQYGTLAKQQGDTRLMAYANLDRARLSEASGLVDQAIAQISSKVHFETLCTTDDLRLRTQDALARLRRKVGQHQAAYDHLAAARDLEGKIYAFRSKRHLQLLNSRIEMQESHAKAERFQLEAKALEMRNVILEKERENLQQSALRDPLTRLGNRRAADATFEAQIEAALEEGHGFQVVYIDLDHFKLVNDTYGHLVGDTVLVKVAELLRNGCRPTDGVFRFGGEEFVVILNDPDAEKGVATCRRLKNRIMHAPWAAIAPDLKVTASFGVADWQGETHQDALKRRADKALYLAKAGGRNLVMTG